MPDAPEKLWLQYSQATRHWIDCDPEDIYSRDAVAYVRLDEAASEGSGAMAWVIARSKDPSVRDGLEKPPEGSGAASEQCPDCNGDGTTAHPFPMNAPCPTCKRCGGAGVIIESDRDAPSARERLAEYVDCPECSPGTSGDDKEAEG